MSPSSHGRVGYEDKVPWDYEHTLSGELGRARDTRTCFILTYMLTGAICLPTPGGGSDSDAGKTGSGGGHEGTVTGQRMTNGNSSAGAEEHILLVCHRKPGRPIDSYVVDGTQVFGEVVRIKRIGGA